MVKTTNQVHTCLRKGAQWQRVLEISADEVDLISYNSAISSCQCLGQEIQWLVAELKKHMFAYDGDYVMYV
jgi:hypothetical protein